ncbi:MAG TPA: bifunctional hydroxymethylpyrimidine kinase/phosphomethylpyrimidine kinase [Kiritimatiellia bacterium]|nr:bifunctional hydroxymethylpyrimidine kinase/phosphomethylpyrimidine kinase [Kiritimatiellia bacterium]HMP35174.1 bifunctional hydroxymethylpyrimidine kinase/phosphomethylpyrimidine kinase [Kiritimatiellia bacterium]
MKHYVRVLTIAGSDSGGGAGVQADLKTFAALGVYGMSAITAITAQNTRGVEGVWPLPPEWVRRQVDAVLDDIGADAIKIGMLGSAEVAMAVAEAIRRYPEIPVVVDPVMVSTSGAVLLTDDARAVLVDQIFPIAWLVTPNLPEVEALTGMLVRSEGDRRRAGEALLGLGCRAVLIKGGHAAGSEVDDWLFQAEAGGVSMQDFGHCRVNTGNTHGTGCTLSAAIAAQLATGDSLVDAVGTGVRFVHEALSAGAGFQIGGGRGPLNHGFDPQAMRQHAGETE